MGAAAPPQAVVNAEGESATCMRGGGAAGGECWGAMLSGTPCDAAKWGMNIRGTSHFFAHFCAACQTKGVRIPANRLRILSREAAQGARLPITETHLFAGRRAAIPPGSKTVPPSTRP